MLTTPPMVCQYDHCVLTGAISQFPFDARKNDLISNLARSRNVKI